MAALFFQIICYSGNGQGLLGGLRPGSARASRAGDCALAAVNFTPDLFFQVVGDGGELFEGGFEVVGDFLRR